MLSDGGKTPVASDTVSPSESSATLLLPSVPSVPGPTTTISVQVSAVNRVGRGPASPPVTLDIDTSLLHSFNYGSSVALGSVTEVWVVALIGTTVFMFLLIGSSLFYYRRVQDSKLIGFLQDSGGPDAADGGPPHKHHHSLWIDRRWNKEDNEAGSSSSEKKLLEQMVSQADSEYTYIDRNKLKSFASTYAAAGGGNQRQKHVDQLDLTPYASTDIFRNNSTSEYLVR